MNEKSSISFVKSAKAFGLEFSFGGLSGCTACLFTNPLEVVKTRLQLQGELKRRGSYNRHYRNFFHALYVIGRHDGLTKLQAGLAPGLVYQFFMNGVRLGFYQIGSTLGLHKDNEGQVIFSRAMIMAAGCGAIGGIFSSPLYMVKTHLQALSNNPDIAVGFQNHAEHNGMWHRLRSQYARGGISGLWRGWEAQMWRVTMGSAVQLSTFSKCKSILVPYGYEADSLSNATLASLMSSFVVTSLMTPFDVVLTRIYNQPTCENFKGKYYKGLFDAFLKISRHEGVFSLYKGATAVFLRTSPHSMISLIAWDRFRQLYYGIIQNNEKVTTA